MNNSFRFVITATLLTFILGMNQRQNDKPAENTEPRSKSVVDSADDELSDGIYRPAAWLKSMVEIAPKNAKLRFDLVLTIDKTIKLQSEQLSFEDALKFLTHHTLKPKQLVELDIRVERRDALSNQWSYHTIGYFQGYSTLPQMRPAIAH